jgi:endonuclease/exonuclease/phosphatase family metal-dependent hydrolase
VRTERIRVATYNVHGCVGIDGRRSEDRIAAVIAALDVDVIGLQELDLNRRRSAGVDQAGLIARRLGWTRFFHPAIQRAEEEYGDAILSRHPMTLRRAAALPAPAPFYCREARGALWAEVTTPIGAVHVFNSHFGLGRRERVIQATLLTGPDWLGKVPANEPVIMLGDFNGGSGSASHRVLAAALRDARLFQSPVKRLRSYPSPRPLIDLDHIFVNDRLTVESVGVVTGGRAASDHLPVRAEIVLA